MPISASLALIVASAIEPAMTTAAGTGQAGYSGDRRPALEARLNMPFDVVVDSRGNLYVSDTNNHCIRRVDATTGTIITVAGRGRKGFSGDGGPAVEAELNEPYGLALDGRGNLYFADRLNRRVRMVEAQTGEIRTVAGNGSRTYSGDGGPATNAGLVEPNGVALDRDGRRLFIADVAGHRVRVVDLAGGQIGTFAGNGQARHAGDGGPADRAAVHGARAVAVGPDGTVYILEREGNCLRAVNPRTGAITTHAGSGAKGYSGDGGPALTATFNGPKELDVDTLGNIFVVDTENHCIRRIDSKAGLVTTVAGDGQRGGEGDGGPARAARLDRPHGVAVGPEGVLYIGDTGNHRVRKVVP